MGCNDCVLFIISNIIGESEAIEGTVNATDDIYSESSKNVSYMTTLITNGKGKGVVTLTGANTSEI